MKYDPMLIAVVIVACISSSLGVPAVAGKLRIKDCSANERASIVDAYAWLRNNVSKIDRQMGRNGLMDWPGKSRKKFMKKLKKDQKIVCINEKRKCQRAKMMARSIPILHQKRIALCANLFSEQADYVSALAHEIGHLIRVNVHRTHCVRLYQRPRFSQSLGLAAFHAFEGTDYNSADYTKYCP